MHRITSALAFPVVDSFPAIFPSLGPLVPHGTDYCAINTRLATNTAVIDKIKSLTEIVSWRVGVDEREALLNDLGEIVDGYQHGWESGSDDDDD